MISERKGIEDVIMPFAEIVASRIPDALILIGGRGPLKKKLSASIKEKPDLPIMLLDFIRYSELPSYIASCDLMLSADKDQVDKGWTLAPLKIAESLAIGRPVIAARIQIAAEDWKDMQGVTWVPRDPREFLDSAVTIKSNYSMYAKIAIGQAQDFEKYTTTFAIAKIAANIIERTM
jgi:glycosyltransferase involved in cell wall biosynthesis